MVEFALVLPLLLVLLLAIIDFGVLYYNDLMLTHAVRDASRSASVGDADGYAKAIEFAQDHVTSATPPIDSVMPEALYGEPVTVSMSSTYSWITPLPAIVQTFFGGGTPGGWVERLRQLNATATMRRE